MPEYGPLYKTQRIDIPGRNAYVEIRQARYSSGEIGWTIEHGDLRFGFRGAWGRSYAKEAFECFTSAVNYEMRKR